MVGGPTFGILSKDDPKSESKHTDADGDGDAEAFTDGEIDTKHPFKEPPVTPTRPGKGKKTGTKSQFDQIFDGDSGTSSDAESVVVSPESLEFTHPVNINVLYTQASLSVSDSSTSSKSPNPRKRTAKAASLPDSISDSERGGKYDGDGVTVTTDNAVNAVKPILTSLVPPEPLAKVPSNNDYSSRVSHQSLPIRIPRPASLDETDTFPENVPLPSDSAPGSAAEYRRYEADGQFCKRDLFGVHHDVPGGDPSEEDAQEAKDEEESLFDAWASLGPHDMDYSKRTPHAADKEQKLDNFSTTVSPGNSSRFGEKQDSLLTYESDASSGTRNGGDIYGVPLARLFTPRTSPAPDSNADAQLIIIEDTLYVQTSPTVSPATYQLSITVSIQAKKVQSYWWELVLSGLPRLRPDEYGYLYFRTPPGQGIEFRTSSFNRNKVYDNYLIAQFVVSSRFVASFRTCDPDFYGFLKDFQINQLIESEVKEDDVDPLSYIVQYRAVCSIELIQRDFWAKKCSFVLYVHGGPHGEYVGNLQDYAGLQTIKLEQRPNCGYGNSQVLITCPRSCLSMFVLEWELKLPYHKAVTWMPQIKTTSDVSEADMRLRLEYANSEPKSDEILEAKSDDRKVMPHLKPVISFVGPKRPHRIVQSLWTLWAIASFLFQLVTILASFTIIYSCSLRKRAGFLSKFDGGYCLVCPQTVSAVYHIPAVNFTHEEWSTKETFQLEVFEPEQVGPETIPPKPVQPESIQPESIQPESIQPESIQPESIQPESIQPESIQPDSQPTIIAPLSLRDRVDYILGWRGPMEKN
jgi:hypothetical protein